MIAGTGQLVFVLLMAASTLAAAETYKCIQNGKALISDSPCAPNAPRVDQQHDKVDRNQQRQAESLHVKNSTQLNELEWKARRDRSTPGGVLILPGPASLADSNRRTR